MESVLTGRQRDQLARMRREESESRFRSRGPAATPSADIARELGLTEAQKKKMNALDEQTRQARAEERKKSRERLKRIEEDRDRKYLDVLTPQQRAKWRKMIGRPRPDV